MKNNAKKDDYLFKTRKMIDYDSGEIITGSVFPAEVSSKYYLVSKASSEAWEKKKAAKEELQYFNEIVGGRYTFSIEESVKELFANDSFSDSEKVHIMYLGSFVNYDGYLMSGNNRNITKSLLKRMVKIRNEKRFYDFYNRLVSLGFIEETSERLYWNTKLSFKGSPSVSGTTSGKVIRTYDETIQRIYEENPSKSLAIIFKLLPYLNKFHNVLCNDTEATDYSGSNPLTVEEVGQAIGEGDKKYLQRRLLKLRVKDEYIFSLRKTGDKTNIIVNPSLVWLSSYPPASNLVGDFSLAKKQLLEDRQKKCNRQVVLNTFC